jgi:FHA domain-containing protein
MLQNIFAKPVVLIIDGKDVAFQSIDDFAFALDARTAIPLDKITEAVKATPGELLLESNAIEIALENLTEIINDSPETISSVTTRLKAINSVVFSNDNGWRNLFSALKKDRSPDSSTYKEIALNKYLEYLSNRKKLIDLILDESNRKNDPEAMQQETYEAVPFRTGELEIDGNYDPADLKEKLGMTDMPKGVAMDFEIEEGEHIDLLLAKYHCKVIAKDGLKFLDCNNIEYPLSIGMNKIGRGKECSIRFIDTMQKISRLHLKIINHDDKNLELIDLSTYGTYYSQ